MLDPAGDCWLGALLPACLSSRLLRWGHSCCMQGNDVLQPLGTHGAAPGALRKAVRAVLLHGQPGRLVQHPASRGPCFFQQPPPPVLPIVPSCRQGCCKRRFGWLLEHIEAQTTCLFDDQGRPAVDFLGRVENLDEDMQASRRRLPAAAVQCNNASPSGCRCRRLRSHFVAAWAWGRLPGWCFHAVGVAGTASTLLPCCARPTPAAATLLPPNPSDMGLQDLVALVNSRLPQGVEPLRVGRMPRWQLGVERLAGKQDELWRYYSELYRNSTTGALRRCCGRQAQRAGAEGQRTAAAGTRLAYLAHTPPSLPLPPRRSPGRRAQLLPCRF